MLKVQTTLVYVKTDPLAPTHKPLSLFLVDSGPGVKVEYVYGLMGTRGGGAGRVVLKVPTENLVGLEHGAGAISYLAINSKDDSGRVRRLVSKAKKVSTQMAWDVTSEAMQIMGGIGYTDVYVIEKNGARCPFNDNITRA